MFQAKAVEEIKTHFLCPVTLSPPNPSLYEIMWKNIVERGMSQMTIWRMRVDMIYLLSAIGLLPGGSSTVHIYTQNNTYNNTNNKSTTPVTTNVEECGSCPVFASFTLVFALQLKKKHGKPQSE
jgi:hypothetical protein